MITVVMTTYTPTDVPERADYARSAISSLVNWLDYPGLRLHVADDGSPDDAFIYDLLSYAESHWGVQGSWTSSKRNGIGASLNGALNAIQTPYWMYTTDDWTLTSPLRLHFAAQLLDDGYDLVRLGPIHPDLQCTTRHHDGNWWLDIHAEAGGFAFATRPFLAAPSLRDKIGPFTEHVDPYDMERIYAERVRQHGDVRIACLGLSGPWTHIGAFSVSKS